MYLITFRRKGRGLVDILCQSPGIAAERWRELEADPEVEGPVLRRVRVQILREVDERELKSLLDGTP